MKKLTTSMIILLIPVLLFAWALPGHMTGGSVAYYYLKNNNPSVLAKAVATLENHPWITTKWKKRLAGLTGEQREITLFMLASIFPDEARMTSLGNGQKTKWHYVDNPFVPQSQHVQGAPPQVPNAEFILDSLFTTLKHSNETADKAIGICWVFHLVEDIHQPLHTASMFTAKLPNGDRGGNDIYIMLNKNADTVKLHSYWDQLPKGTIKNIPAKAEGLLLKDEYKESNLIELTTNPTLDNWIKNESFPLAETDAYQEGKINGSKTKPKAVTSAYIKNAKKIAEKRVVLSGIRLAKKLIEIYS